MDEEDSGKSAHVGGGENGESTVAEPNHISKKSIDLDPADQKEYDVPLELRCGYLCWRPNCIQGCNDPKALLSALCYFVVIQGFAVNGLLAVNLSSLERRFHFTSVDVAWIAVSYDISAAIFSVIFGYTATFLHNGKVLTTGALIMGLGSFTMFLPHLLVGEYELGGDFSAFCPDTQGNEDCPDEGSNLRNYMYVFITGQVLHGIGGAALHTLSLPYLDENIRTTNTPLYVGIFHCFAVVGPAIAYIFGGFMLEIYVDVGRVDMDDISITSDDPRWVGAWWLGYFIAAILALTVSCVTACFPRELPSALMYRSGRKSDAHRGFGDERTQEEGFGRSWRDVGYSLVVLFINPVWWLLTLSGMVEGALIAAFTVFLPKLMEFQFRITATQAAIIVGCIVLPGAAGGQLLGGIIPKFFKLGLRGQLRQCFICGIFTMLSGFIYLIYCDLESIAGITVDYTNGTAIDEVSLYDSCHAGCNCTTRSYDPVCAVNDIQYFTPCHAGCTNTTEIDGTTYYYDCSCIDGSNSTWYDGVSGGCEDSCPALILFSLLLLIECLFVFSANTAGYSCALRVVPDKERAFGFGIQSFFARLFGNVPGPLIFGAIFDKFCMVWQEYCDDTGSCWLYESEGLSVGLTMSVVIGGAFIALCFLLSLIVYKPPKSETDEIDVTDEAKEAETESNSGVPVKDDFFSSYKEDNLAFASGENDMHEIKQGPVFQSHKHNMYNDENFTTKL